jgi:hypothetical protein
MHLQQDPQGPELDPMTRLHTADPQHVKDLQLYDSRKTKDNLEEGEHGKNINTAS